jgi:hypothetical protein
LPVLFDWSAGRFPIANVAKSGVIEFIIFNSRLIAVFSRFALMASGTLALQSVTLISAIFQLPLRAFPVFCRNKI